MPLSRQVLELLAEACEGIPGSGHILGAFEEKGDRRTRAGAVRNASLDCCKEIGMGGAGLVGRETQAVNNIR